MSRDDILAVKLSSIFFFFNNFRSYSVLNFIFRTDSVEPKSRVYHLEQIVLSL